MSPRILWPSLGEKCVVMPLSFERSEIEGTNGGDDVPTCILQAIHFLLNTVIIKSFLEKAILDIKIQSSCPRNMAKLRMKLRDKSNDNRMRKFATIKREEGRKGEAECSKGVSSGTKIDIQIRALESDPQNTFNLNSAIERRNVTGRENKMLPIVVIHPLVMQTTKEVRQPEMIVTIQNLFGTKPVLLSIQDA
jgi:hypothetical protein